MKQERRAPFAAALDRARRAAYPAGEYVGQESFMGARDIRRVAARAGIDAGTRVIDLCCGVAGPGRLIAGDTGCDYLGIDSSPSALSIAQRRCEGMRCRFLPARIPPLPDLRADVVLLLSTMLAFADKATLIREVARALAPGGRFACTVEVGPPLTGRERRDMPDADTVWLIEEAELRSLLRRAGLRVLWTHDATAARGTIARALLAAYTDDADDITAGVGPDALQDLVGAHLLWTAWLGTGRVRDLEIVACRP